MTRRIRIAYKMLRFRIALRSVTANTFQVSDEWGWFE